MTEHLNARYIRQRRGRAGDRGRGQRLRQRHRRHPHGARVHRDGVAGIHLEDQVIPKRGGHVAGRMVIPIEEAVSRYRGAHGGRLDEAIRRANAHWSDPFP
jgi:2-methylisocitrate lyase-like PEP mutase family enzyme